MFEMLHLLMSFHLMTIILIVLLSRNQLRDKSQQVTFFSHLLTNYLQGGEFRVREMAKKLLRRNSECGKWQKIF